METELGLLSGSKKKKTKKQKKALGGENKGTAVYIFIVISQEDVDVSCHICYLTSSS
jgi:hypothetical protein